MSERKESNVKKKVTGDKTTAYRGSISKISEVADLPSMQKYKVKTNDK